MRGAFHFEEDRDLQPCELGFSGFGHFGDAQRLVVADAKKNADLWRGAATGLKRELLILAYLRSGKSVPTWRHVVLNRKGSIAMGGGWVNSQQFDFSGLITG